MNPGACSRIRRRSASASARSSCARSARRPAVRRERRHELVRRAGRRAGDENAGAAFRRYVSAAASGDAGASLAASTRRAGERPVECRARDHSTERALVLADTSSRWSCRGTRRAPTARGSRARSRAEPTTSACSSADTSRRPSWPNVRRAAPQVDRDVEHLAGDRAHQLSLRVLDLVVQAAQHAAPRARVVVLHEVARRCPASRSARAFKLSKKKPRASPNTRGSTILTSGMSVAMTRMAKSSTALGR